MYAVKHALMTKEHLPQTEYTVFFMDLRAYGKGFDAYYQRAQQEGVRFVRARPATVDEVGENRNLRIKYLNERGEFKDEEFDLVVLSSGMRPAAGAVEVARQLGIERTTTATARRARWRPWRPTAPASSSAAPSRNPRTSPRPSCRPAAPPHAP
jgi:heterodisulfide reductase subunit A